MIYVDIFSLVAVELHALLGYTGSFVRGALHHSLREGEKFRKWKGHHLFFQKRLQKKCHFQDVAYLLFPKKIFSMLDQLDVQDVR